MRKCSTEPVAVFPLTGIIGRDSRTYNQDPTPKAIKGVLHFAAIVAMLLLAAISMAAPASSDKSIELYKKASGKAAGELKSTVMTGKVKLAGGAEGQFNLTAMGPDRLRVDVDAGQIKFSECYNGKSAWLQDEKGLRTLLGHEAQNLRLLGLIWNRRLRDLSRYRILTAPGANGTITLKFSEAESKISFDPASHLIAQIDRGTLDALPKLAFADYKQVDRVMEPHLITIGEGDAVLALTVGSVQHNSAVALARFDYPQVTGRALPEVEVLLKSLTANQEKIEELREHYTFREVQTERVLDGGGRVKETHDKIFEVTPVAGRLVERLVSDNGKPLSASDQEKEDRRVQKEVEDIIKRKEERDEKKAKEKEEGKDGNSERDEDRVTVLSFLKTSEVTSERWEKLDGKDVIAFDFEPRSHFKPNSRAESLISKLAGTMWIDPEAQQVARLQAHFTGSFKVGGGLLASVGQSTAFAIEQKNVDGEIWLPSYFEANLSARVMLLARFNRSFTTVYSDYKKYQINSKYELKPPPEEKKNSP